MAETEEGTSRREQARIIAALVVAAVLVAFVLDNTHSVTVGFVFDEREAPLIWVLLVTAVLGGIIGRLLAWMRRRGT